MQDRCIFCPFLADTRFNLLLHCEAEHTKRHEHSSCPPLCSCGFTALSWEDFRRHLWDKHGGGLAARPAHITRLSGDELKMLINMATRPGVQYMQHLASTGGSPHEEIHVTHSEHLNPGEISTYHGLIGASPLQNMPTHASSNAQIGFIQAHNNSVKKLYENRETVNGLQYVPSLSNQTSRGVKRLLDSSEAEGSSHVCRMCDKSYVDEAALARHKRDAHPNGRTQVFTCTECGCEFMVLKTARLHLDQHGLKSQPLRFLKKRLAEAGELPLIKCKFLGCPYRSSVAALTDHYVHKDLIYAYIPDKDVPSESVSNGHSSLGAGMLASPKDLMPAIRGELKEINCQVVDGYIRIPAGGMSGKYIMVSADGSGLSSDIIINISNQPETNMSHSNGAFSHCAPNFTYASPLLSSPSSSLNLSSKYY